MRSSVLVVAVVLLAGWASPSWAVGLSGAGSSAGLLKGPGSARDRLHLLSPGEVVRLAEGQTQATPRDPGPFADQPPTTRALIAVGASFILGFGLGHWVLGDPGFRTFLTLDAVLIGVEVVLMVVSVVGWAMAFAAIASGGTGTLPAGAVIFAVAGVAMTIVGLVLTVARIWQVIDCVMKATKLTQTQSPSRADFILSPAEPSPGWARSDGLQPAFANGFSWRF